MTHHNQDTERHEVFGMKKMMPMKTGKKKPAKRMLKKK
jgi:hypothetical protein